MWTLTPGREREDLNVPQESRCDASANLPVRHQSFHREYLFEEFGIAPVFSLGFLRAMFSYLTVQPSGLCVPVRCLSSRVYVVDVSILREIMAASVILTERSHLRENLMGSLRRQQTVNANGYLALRAQDGALIARNTCLIAEALCVHGAQHAESLNFP
jgi:hypothetical protein